MALGWVTKAPIGATLVLNNQYGFGTRHGGKAQISLCLIIIGFDLAEELIGFLQTIRKREIDFDAFPSGGLLQAEMERVSIQIVGIGNLPIHLQSPGAKLTHIEGKRLIQWQGRRIAGGLTGNAAASAWLQLSQAHTGNEAKCRNH